MELIIILQAFWFLLPAGVANMSPTLFKWVPFLNIPLDFNLTLRGKPVLGANKTYRGFLFGVLSAILVVFLQSILAPYMGQFSIIDYDSANIVVLGFLLGFGALFGDAAASFVKRQVGKKPGEVWIPWDQIDWILGAFVFVSFYEQVTSKFFLVSLVLFGLLHPLINYIGYLLKIKTNKF